MQAFRAHTSGPISTSCDDALTYPLPLLVPHHAAQIQLLLSRNPRRIRMGVNYMKKRGCATFWAHPPVEALSIASVWDIDSGDEFVDAVILRRYPLSRCPIRHPRDSEFPSHLQCPAAMTGPSWWNPLPGRCPPVVRYTFSYLLFIF